MALRQVAAGFGCGENEHLNTSRPSSVERVHAGANGRPGREYVIHKKDSWAPNKLRRALKGSLHVHTPLQLVESDLLRSISYALQKIAPYKRGGKRFDKHL